MLKQFIIVFFTVIFLIFISSTKPFLVIGSDEYIFDTQITQKTTLINKIFEKTGFLIRLNKSSKAKYWRKLVDKRLAEFKLVVENDDKGAFEETSSRYSTYVANYSDYLLNSNLVNEKSITKQQFDKHQEILNTFKDKYEYNSAWWILVMHPINTLEIFKLKVEKL
ncbi:hypothetical protein A2130_03550 [Candidatus Woesebacteria bacterium GWC2_33_12]|uniref:DUF5667 domain-containing protein n=1 Tax=Candidatus Woesebacteria bacterium GW2011_GWB1_33_22 TaxID=1618566 RepID=A0A0F9ZMP8_9BACT|nr:MAG: hypothetical protein UR29_C0001G0029 [Candidatus Woesebacteria bacterium GW2011_GWC2_33_12]KKP42761.1 MAG: hypothetical protein UR33_C0001G0122 [Candidatus Woesebacteria bacterium GW2011_GWA2_33_20]KKP45464.1 MAG: hypothetical protein UR35_C0001G0061 [Candidatus Woesebacteria bacterium GW2011_GWB1_33_22]KKP47336.1 MAG: hypothetical protein UR37_C0001G0029 [Microgenomates group bacterium GW2011_GWC1_33_28]KKP51082.1 MAG: hypothetical protein UR41_C0001G0029 [Candidatus Woesebacteria bact